MEGLYHHFHNRTKLYVILNPFIIPIPIIISKGKDKLQHQIKTGKLNYPRWLLIIYLYGVLTKKTKIQTYVNENIIAKLNTLIFVLNLDTVSLCVKVNIVVCWF